VIRKKKKVYGETIKVRAYFLPLGWKMVCARKYEANREKDHYATNTLNFHQQNLKVLGYTEEACSFIN